MRVLHVVTRSQTRGAERAAIELATALDERGHHNVAVALGPAYDGSCIPELEPITRRTRLGSTDFAACVRALGLRLRRNRFDVLLAHGGFAASVAVMTRRSLRPRTVWQRILPFPPQMWRGARRRWWQLVVRRVDGCIALTDDDAIELRQIGFTGKMEVIPNFRDPARFASADRAAAAMALRSEVGLSADAHVVGFVGHLVRQKRPERALEVIERVNEIAEPTHLVIAGDGPLRADLENRARHLRSSDRITFCGNRADIERVYAGIDLLLVTSESEGIPGVVIEAQMSGCPVVAQSTGGIGEVVADGTTGVLLEGYEPERTARVVAGLLADSSERERLGRAARARGLDFSIDSVAQRYESFLEMIRLGIS